MRTLLPLALLPLVACGTSFKAEGLDVPLDTLTSSYAERQTYDYDLDEDGTVDLTVTGIGAILSDRDDLCSAGSASELDDVLAVQVIALYEGDAPAEIITNASAIAMLSEPEPGDMLVGVQVIHKVGGAVVSDHVTRNLLEQDWNRGGSLFVTTQSVNNGELRGFGGSFDGVLEADRTDPADPVDTSIDFKGRIAGAEICDDLDILF